MLSSPLLMLQSLHPSVIAFAHANLFLALPEHEYGDARINNDRDIAHYCVQVAGALSA
jgi:hypothetical protein